MAALTRALTVVLRPMLRFTPYGGESRRAILPAWLMHTWLKHFPDFERPFPIPIRVEGAEALAEAKTNPHGMGVFSVHLPLTNLTLTTLLDLGYPPDAAVSHPDGLKDGLLPVWGRGVGYPALATSRNVLFGARAILRAGGMVAGLLDTNLGAPLNGNMLHLLGRFGARAVFAIPMLDKDCVVVLRFYTPPDPFCKTPESITANLAFLQNKMDELLAMDEDPRSQKRLPARDFSEPLRND
jgi:hypothetical protein